MKKINVFYEPDKVDLKVIENSKCADIIVDTDDDDGVVVRLFPNNEDKVNYEDVCDFQNNTINSREVNTKEKELESKITELLIKLGMSMANIGFMYSKYAINILYNDFSSIDSIERILYKEIAVKYNTTSPNVYRSIRYAISVAITRADYDVWNKVFIPDRNCNFLRIVGNKEFLATVSEYLKYY